MSNRSRMRRAGAVAAVGCVLAGPVGGSAATATVTTVPSTPSAWGDNSYGQLGNPTTIDGSTPVLVSSLSGVTAIATGAFHSLALKSDGTVWAWGGNVSGQLGNGTTTDSHIPVAVSGLSGVASIAGGGYHNLALKLDGTLWAWGGNFSGQLGDGTTTDRHTPVQVFGLSGAPVTAIAGGNGFSLAMKSDGTVWAWGYNSSGTLGDGTTTTRLAPVQVSGLNGVASIAGGTAHSLALKSDGTVWAWGANYTGQLGNGTTTDSYIPVAVSSLSGVTAIASGGAHSLAVKSDGTVWAWGFNDRGQLGNGTTTLNPNPTPVQVSGLSGAIAIAGGNSHSLAVKSDGTVWAWGANGAGQLGNGSRTGNICRGQYQCSDHPVQSSLIGVTAVASNSDSNHSLALNPTGLLRVTSSPAVSTQILVDGQITASWSLTRLKLAAGSHIVCFTHVQGYTEPPCRTVTVNAGATTTVTGTFSERGTLRVITSPTVPSQITVDGNPTNDFGLWTDITTGSHTVCFGNVFRYSPPACQTATVTAGALTTITGTFRVNPSAFGEGGVGLLRLTTSPALPSQITITPAGGSPYIADSSGLNWLELPLGSYTVSFSFVQGWTEPEPQTVTITRIYPTTVTGAFTQRGFLRVTTSPAVPGTIAVDGIPRDDWGMWTDISTGSHTVCFGAVSGYANTPACQTVTLNPGATTTVTGAYS